MTAGTIDSSQRTAAKVAGFACLFGMAIVVYSNYGIYEHLMVPGNVAETARNIVAHETLFRLSLVCNVTYYKRCRSTRRALRDSEAGESGPRLGWRIIPPGICLDVASYRAQSAGCSATFG